MTSLACIRPILVFIWPVIASTIGSTRIFVNSSTVAEVCGEQVHSATQGSIQSPGYPGSYPSGISCVWQITGSRGSIISISFVTFDVDDDENMSSCNHSVAADDQRQQPACCTSAWLKIGVPDTEEPLVLCGSGYVPKPYLSSGPDVYIKFHAGSLAKARQGFKLLYLIIPLEVPCRPNETSCTPNSYECHPKCDRVMQCPSGVDEIGCVKGCQGRIMCSSWNGCYLPDERCNGVAQCGDHSDERNCSPDLCRSNRGGFLCNNLQCIRESWQCDQTNDCGDNSDEVNCLKNSVITAAIMGSLICGLLLVIAIGCTCKLYALRYSEAHESGTLATLPMSPLEQELLHREPPPPYSIAVSQPPLTYFTLGSQPSHPLDPFSYARMCRGLHHHRRGRRARRQRRQPPPPPPLQPPSSCLLFMPPEPNRAVTVSGSAAAVPPQSSLVAVMPDGFLGQYSRNPCILDSRVYLPSAGHLSSSTATGSKTPVLSEQQGEMTPSQGTADCPITASSEMALSAGHGHADSDDCPLLDNEQ